MYLKLGQVNQVTRYREYVDVGDLLDVQSSGRDKKRMSIIVHNDRARMSLKFRQKCSDNDVGLVPVGFDGSVVLNEEAFYQEFVRRITRMLSGENRLEGSSDSD